MNDFNISIPSSRLKSSKSYWGEENRELTQIEASTPEPFQTINTITHEKRISKAKFLSFFTLKERIISILVGFLLVGSIIGLGFTTFYYSNNVGIASKVGYGESCLNNQCFDIQSLQCINSTCQCDSITSFWNSSLSTCQSISLDFSQHGGYCQKDYTQCLSNTICLNSICKCNSTNYFWSGLTCTPKLTYNSACGLNNSTNCVSDEECSQCLSSSLLQCNIIIGNCSCLNNSFYDSSISKCAELKYYFNYSTSSSQCDSTKGLFCQNTTGNLTANCPSVSTLNYCDCSYGLYFDFNYDKCMLKKSFNRQCSQSCECDSVNRGLGCYGGICSCPKYTYFNSVSCVSSGYKTGYYSSICNSNYDCNSDFGLICSNVSICDCVLTSNYYWSTTLKVCVECPPGWIILKTSNSISRCYLISTSQTTWTIASQRCSYDNAYLLPIQDIYEYNLIYSYFSTQSYYKWYHMGVFSLI